MITRRQVLVSGIACAFAVGMVPWAYAEDDIEFICGAFDADPEVLAIEDMAAGEAQAIQDMGTDLLLKDITPFGVANLADCWRRGDGLTPNTGVITLGVYFADGTPQQKDTVKLHASKWLEGNLGNVLAFKWDVPQAQCQISVTFNTNKNSSRIGRQSRTDAKSSITMHLSQTVERTVCHEFGHALGLRHEHSSPNGQIKWNKPKVIADMALQGWSEAMVTSNIFAKYGQDYACIGDPDMNLKSVMLYPFPASWTTDGFSTGQNSKIDARDRKCVVALYQA